MASNYFQATKASFTKIQIRLYGILLELPKWLFMISSLNWVFFGLSWWERKYISIICAKKKLMKTLSERKFFFYPFVYELPYFIIYEAVCKTAPATQGLLNTELSRDKAININEFTYLITSLIRNEIGIPYKVWSKDVRGKWRKQGIQKFSID